MFVWCSNKKESEALVKHCNEQGIRWSDLGKFECKFKTGGVGYDILLGCLIYKEDKDKFDVVNYEEVFTNGDKAKN